MLKIISMTGYGKKNAGGNFLSAKYQPMKEHETISIFTKQGEKSFYYPIKQDRVSPVKGKTIKLNQYDRIDGVYNARIATGQLVSVPVLRNPSSVQCFKRERGYHPTQKPIALLEYLIKTYTLPNQIVLDFTMGSGSTGVACKNTGRKFIGIELDRKYFKIAKKRLAGKI